MRFTSTTALLLGLSAVVSAAPLLSHEIETPTTASIDTRSPHSRQPQPTSSTNVDDIPDSYYYSHDNEDKDISLDKRDPDLQDTWSSSLKWYPNGNGNGWHPHTSQPKRPREETTQNATDVSSSLEKRFRPGGWPCREGKWSPCCNGCCFGTFGRCPKPLLSSPHSISTEEPSTISSEASTTSSSSEIPSSLSPTTAPRTTPADYLGEAGKKAYLDIWKNMNKRSDSESESDSNANANANPNITDVQSLEKRGCTACQPCHGPGFWNGFWCPMAGYHKREVAAESDDVEKTETNAEISARDHVHHGPYRLNVTSIQPPVDLIQGNGQKVYVPINGVQTHVFTWRRHVGLKCIMYLSGDSIWLKPPIEPSCWQRDWQDGFVDAEEKPIQGRDASDNQESERSQAILDCRNVRQPSFFLSLNPNNELSPQEWARWEECNKLMASLTPEQFEQLNQVLADYIKTHPVLPLNPRPVLFPKSKSKRDNNNSQDSTSRKITSISWEDYQRMEAMLAKADGAGASHFFREYPRDHEGSDSVIPSPNSQEVSESGSDKSKRWFRYPHICWQLGGCNADYLGPDPKYHEGPRAGTRDLPRKPVHEASRNFLSAEQFEELYANPSSQEPASSQAASELDTRTPNLIDLFKEADSDHVSQEDFDDYDDTPGDFAVPDHGLGGFKRHADEAPSWNEMKVMLSKTLKDEDVLKGWESSVDDCHWDAQTPTCYQTALLQFTTSAYQRTMATMGYLPEQARRYAEAYSFNMDALKAQAGAMAQGCGADMETTPRCMKGLPAVFAEKLLN